MLIKERDRKENLVFLVGLIAAKSRVVANQNCGYWGNCD
jgi:hypothetical protein